MNVFSTLRQQHALKAGLLLGAIFSTLNLRKLTKQYDCKPAATEKYPNKYYFLLIHTLKYWLNYPLFTVLLSISLKKIFQKRATSSTINLTVSTLLSSFVIHSTFPIFNNEMALYFLLRSMHSFYKFITPSDFHPDPILIYPLIHLLCSLPITYYTIYSSDKLWYMFEKCISENRHRWEIMLCHNHHCLMPNCGKIVHSSHPESCWKAAIIDVKDRFLLAFPYFFQLILYSKLIFNLQSMIKDKKVIVKVVKSVMIMTLQSSIYFVGGIMSVTRILCITKWIFNVFKKDKYQQIGWNNAPFMLTMCALMGAFSLSFTTKSRQTDICISVLWNAMLNINRMIVGLKGNENEKYHWVLGSKYYTAAMVAICITFTMYIYIKNPKLMKSTERNIFKKYILSH